MAAYWTAAKYVLYYYVFGKKLPSWDLRMQVVCDVARQNFSSRFMPSIDNDMDNIDFDAIYEGFQKSQLPPSKFGPESGVRCAHRIPVADISVDPDSMKGIGIAEDAFRGLVQDDIDAANDGCPRSLPYELLVAWSACERYSVSRDECQRVLDPTPLDSDERIVLHLHGGSYVMGSPASHRESVGEVAKVSGRRCFLVDYRLAPRYPFPAQIHDALISYYYLQSLGYKPQNIVLSGDSAGSHICLGLVLLLKHMAQRATGVQLPGALVLLSPMTAVDFKGETMVTNAQYDFLVAIPLEWPTSPIRMFYKPGHKHTGDYRMEIEHPLLTPTNADLSGFPPTLIQAGDKEMLLDDIRLFAEALMKANPCAGSLYEEYPDMVHVFHRFIYRPEAVSAFKSIGDFIASVKPSS